MVEILQLVHEISSFPEVLYERSVLKNFSKFRDKHKKQSSGGVLSKERMFLKILQNSQKHLCWSFFFNRVAGWKPKTVRNSHWRCSVKQGVLGACNFIKRLRHRCFPVKFANFLTTSLNNICECLLLNFI